MGSNAILIILCIFFLASTVSATKLLFLSEHIINRLNETHGRALAEGGDQITPGRRVLKKCPVDFGKIGYGYLKRRCKGPEYPAQSCCVAFKRFSCPYSDLLNDETTDCSRALSCNLQLHFPLGLFSDNKCKGGPIGLECFKWETVPLPGFPAVPKSGVLKHAFAHRPLRRHRLNKGRGAGRIHRHHQRKHVVRRQH